jgi:hypothetical protein
MSRVVAEVVEEQEPMEAAGSQQMVEALARRTFVKSNERGRKQCQENLWCQLWRQWRC